jgi:hypothetical protein
MKKWKKSPEALAGRFEAMATSLPGIQKHPRFGCPKKKRSSKT